MHANPRFLLVALALAACSTAPAAVSSSDDVDDPAAGDDGASSPGKGQGKGPAADSAGAHEDDPAAAPPAASGPCVAGDPFDPAALRATLSYLASVPLAGRAPGSSGDLASRAFVEKQLGCLGIQPGGVNGTFQQPFTDSDKNASANVIGVIAGADPVVGKDVIVVSAHQDHFGGPPNKLRLGANDNASGVTTVLAVAKAMKQLPTPPKRTIAFMIFNSEELGCEGSHEFVDKGGLPNLPIGKVVYAVNFDMVGTYTQMGKTVEAHGTLPGTPARVIIDGLLAKPGALGGVHVGVDGLGEDDSDYWPFCAKGIPMAAFFTDDPACYHKPCDTEEKIDYPNMGKIGKLGADIVAALASTSTDLAAYRKSAKVANLGCGEPD